jgi:ATP-binding cassette subfamily B protein
MTSATRAIAIAAATGGQARGRHAWLLLWRASRPLSLLVIAWAVLSAVISPLVVAALGLIVGRIPAAIEHGMGSPAGHGLIDALIGAALIYGLSLVVDPIGSALGTASDALVTGDIQHRLLDAVSAPVGIGHLEDPDVLDRLARAEGSLTGYFPGSAPVTWVGVLATRWSGIIGCAVIAYFQWWLGLGLFVLWVAVRRLMLTAVVRQATELRSQTTVMRRAWYLIGVGSKVRDAKEVRVFGLADFVAGRYQQAYREAIDGGVGGLRSVHVRALLCWLVVAGGFALALADIAESARTGSIGLRSLAILLPMIAVTMSLGTVSLDDITLAWTLAGLPDVDRLEQELGTSVTGLDGLRSLDGRPAGRICFERVRFRYPNGAHDVLAGIDLELPVGTSTAVVGVNGAGKSTLVSLLCRLRDPTEGRITVDGTDLHELDASQWQRLVAVMPQDPVRYPFSAYDNVALGALEHRDDRAGVEEVARLSGFAEVVGRLAGGWDTVLSRELGGVELSGGQWQRLALARALFATRHGARLLVLDEPTAALDVRSEAAFYSRFLQITQELTTVVISHRFATVRRADRICVLDGGRITELGDHDELVAAGGTYAQAYAVQAARFGGRS